LFVCVFALVVLAILALSGYSGERTDEAQIQTAWDEALREAAAREEATPEPTSAFAVQRGKSRLKSRGNYSEADVFFDQDDEADADSAGDVHRPRRGDAPDG
jgi:hypothetical protein